MKNIEPLLNNHRKTIKPLGGYDQTTCDICMSVEKPRDLYKTLGDHVVCGACGSALHDIYVANYWSVRVTYAVRYLKCYAKNRLPQRTLEQLVALKEADHENSC